MGWWAADRLSHDWELGGFHKEGKSLLAEGLVGEHRVRLVKPLTWMNRSGAVLRAVFDGDPARDLMVIVDDVHLEPGRLRMRAKGSAGGHNGLESVEAVLGTREYARLRIGVGEPPPRIDMADWVLSEMDPEDEERVLERLEEVRRGLETWLDEGVEAAMNAVNR